MTAEIGLFALVLALFVAAIQSAVPLIGAARGEASWMAVARPAAMALFAMVALAFGALVWVHVTSDFSVVNVVENSHTDKPLLYKITGVWGNHEGSMVLWTFILALYGLAVALFGGNLPPALRARVLSVQGMIAFGFLLFIIETSNPFLRMDPASVNGYGLNPLLQDPGLAFHPPFLYLGYVGFSMAFSFAIAALIEGKVDAAWARWVRPWTLAAWCALTLGIAMGSWWSYYTLGWGGYWAWDPVENASLMPWLAGTALLHSAIVAEKRDSLKAWTIFLAIVTFSLSLLGTFLVRSGVLTSVHAFATDPARGSFILILLGLVTGASLVLFALRAPALQGGGVFAPVSREGALLFNNVFLATAAATVLLGTLYPLFSDALHLDKISVAAPYFNATVPPLIAPLILVMAAGPLLSWKRGDLKGALERLKFAAPVALVTIIAVLLLAGWHDAWTAVWMGLAVWLFAGTFTDWAGRIGLFRTPFADAMHRARKLPRSIYGMSLAHAGLAIALIGIAGSTSWQSEKLLVMHPGQTASIAGYDVRLDGIADNVRGPNYSATRATFVASRGGSIVATLHPERRLYDNPPEPKSTVGIHTNFVSDLYTVLGESDGKGGVAVHLFHNPLVPWIFFGAVLMVLGGAVSLSDRRYRIGAPARKPGIEAPPVLVASVPLVIPWRKLLRAWQYLLPVAVFVVLIGFFVFRLHQAGEGETPNLVPSVMIDKPAPHFDLPPVLAGLPGLRSEDLKGRVTLVNFFASWCAACRIEHPYLSQVSAAGIRLVGVDYKDKPVDARAWLGALGNPYQAVGGDRNGTTGFNFGVYGAPESYLIDKNGVIRFKQIGALTPEIIRNQIIPLAEKLK
ncbi:MAG: heme lyase CcmF/NrfE family subunit [Alphaproteobacteria bacterium]|nr:heme lyase CcmF/NrfE family subunit [Alphaproteobacteria bacterium]